ncbi:hypothetical protein YC2023_083052 [Brassica napus]
MAPQEKLAKDILTVATMDRATPEQPHSHNIRRALLQRGDNMEATNTKRTYTKRVEKKQPLQTKHSGAIIVTGRTHPLRGGPTTREGGALNNWGVQCKTTGPL